MNRDTNQWQQVDELLDELLDLGPQQQVVRLAEIAKADSELADKLERMLGSLSQSDSLEHLSESTLCREAFAGFSGLGPGDQLGAWTLQRQIGRGGMAEVFEAERLVGEAPQRAAIKLMALGLGSEAQRRRFQQETAILARLEDHRLSRLIDAGTSTDGRPWLAMEYVDGEPIDRYCDRQGLNVRERVALLIEVASAVDHTHRLLVVHRDLKPGNVFVSRDGQVKLLDFGIAKVQQPDATDTEHTATHARAFTLRYASPEQLSGRPTGVDCDVYQLGLILYLLLCGTRAFHDSDDDPVALLAAMQRAPQMPSQRALAMTPEVAAARGASPRRLASSLRGDLDSIVMHALEADPERRYPGARELADDLQRWLDGRPISARAFSRGYRTWRYLRRHWIGAAAVSAIAALLIGYAITLTYQSKRLTEERNQAEQARQRAEAIQDFLLQVFGSVDTEAQASRGKSVEQLLIEGVERARSEFPDQPLLAAQLLMDMGTVLGRRAHLEEAETAYQTALNLRREQLGDDHPDSLASLALLGDLRNRLGDRESAHALLREHFERAERVFGDPSDQLVDALKLLGSVESVQGDIEQAEAYLLRAIAMHQALHGDAPFGADRVSIAVDRASVEHQLAVILLRQRRYKEAEPLLREAIEIYDRQFGSLDLRQQEARKNWAFSLRMLRQPDQAKQVFLNCWRTSGNCMGGPIGSPPIPWAISPILPVTSRTTIRRLICGSRRNGKPVNLWVRRTPGS